MTKQVMTKHVVSHSLTRTARHWCVPFAVLFAATLPLAGQAYAGQPVRDRTIAPRPTLSVEGPVASVRVSETGAIFLNLGRPYPHQSFTAIVLPADARYFPSPARWEGQYVRVTGVLGSYDKRPAMLLGAPSQLVKASPWSAWTSQYRAQQRAAGGQRVW